MRSLNERLVYWVFASTLVVIGYLGVQVGMSFWGLVIGLGSFLIIFGLAMGLHNYEIWLKGMNDTLIQLEILINEIKRGKDVKS